MVELRRWWHHFTQLVTTTGRVWWRLLPALLTVQFISFTLVQGALLFTGVISAEHPWPAVAILSLALLVKLTGAVICLR